MKTCLENCALRQSLVMLATVVSCAVAVPAVAEARGSDRDGDGLTNRLEVKVSRTDPRRADTDRDALRDGYEIRQSRTDPRLADTDRDGLRDGVEVRELRTDPRRGDTDRDGASDGREVMLGTDPRRKPGRTPKPVPAPSPTPEPTPQPDPAPQPDPEPAPQPDPAPQPTPPPDATAPETTISSGPAGTVASGSATFSFASSEPGSFTCRLDGGTWGSCASPKSYSALPNGTHTFSVRATDAAGNADATPASRSWTVAVATPSPGNNCMPNPSECGFPDIENTGTLPNVPRETVSGSVYLKTPGMVYENKTVRGDIIVTAANVTIRNVELVATNENYGIRAFGWNSGVDNLVVEDSEIDMNGHLGMKGIAFDEYTLRRVFIHNGSDCAHFGNDVLIEDSLCVNGPDTDGNAWPDNTAFCSGIDHFDGFQTNSGRNSTIRHNTLRNPCSQTSNIAVFDDGGPGSNITVSGNLLAGGGYTVYCPADFPATNVNVTGNRFAKTYSARSGYWGTSLGCSSTGVTFSGNVWDDTGAAL